MKINRYLARRKVRLKNFLDNYRTELGKLSDKETKLEKSYKTLALQTALGYLSKEAIASLKKARKNIKQQIKDIKQRKSKEIFIDCANDFIRKNLSDLESISRTESTKDYDLNFIQKTILGYWFYSNPSEFKDLNSANGKKQNNLLKKEYQKILVDSKKGDFQTALDYLIEKGFLGHSGAIYIANSISFLKKKIKKKELLEKQEKRQLEIQSIEDRLRQIGIKDDDIPVLAESIVGGEADLEGTVRDLHDLLGNEKLVNGLLKISSDLFIEREKYVSNLKNILNKLNSLEKKLGYIPDELKLKPRKIKDLKAIAKLDSVAETYFLGNQNKDIVIEDKEPEYFPALREKEIEPEYLRILIQSFKGKTGERYVRRENLFKNFKGKTGLSGKQLKKEFNNLIKLLIQDGFVFKKGKSGNNKPLTLNPHFTNYLEDAEKKEIAQLIFDVLNNNSI